MPSKGAHTFFFNKGVQQIDWSTSTAVWHCVASITFVFAGFGHYLKKPSCHHTSLHPAFPSVLHELFPFAFVSLSLPTLPFSAYLQVTTLQETGRETKREKATDREKDREKQSEKERQRERERDRQTERETKRAIDREKEGERERER